MVLPVVLLLTVGLAAAGALISVFWNYEKNVLSIPAPLTATVIEDLPGTISPLDTFTLRVSISNSDSSTYTVRLWDNSVFVSGVCWGDVLINGAIPDEPDVFTPYVWGDPLVMATGDQHNFAATITAAETIGDGTSTIRISGTLE